MGVQLTDEELWDFIRESHTGILTTLDRDGFPISLPTWHVAHERRVYIRTLDASAKSRRIRRDTRVCFLVESGEKWIDLKAAALVGRARHVTDESVVGIVRTELGEKYRGYRRDRQTLPDAVQRHYGRQEAIIEIEADRTILSWHNRKIRSR